MKPSSLSLGVIAIASGVIVAALLMGHHGRAASPPEAAAARSAGPLLGEPSGASPVDEDRAGPELSEAEILGVLVASNATEIAHGHEVARRLTDEALREYASDMIMAHTQAQVKLSALARAHAQSPEGGPLTQELASREAAVSRALQAEPASVQLDRQYALAEMLHHRELLELIDYALLPESRGSALRAELLHARNASEQRLQRIRRLAQRMGLQESAVLTQR